MRGGPILALLSTSAILLAAPASAQQLGGARDIEIPIIQLLAGLVLCSLAALAVALLMRRRAGVKTSWLNRLLHRSGERHTHDGIKVLESRRLSVHADVCRFTAGDREYVVIVSQHSTTIVSDRVATPPDATDGRAGGAT